MLRRYLATSASATASATATASASASASASKNSIKSNFKFHPEYKFKCGLEIHTQLKTKYKLFSLSRTSFNDTPNSHISYFDVGLPGTQPKLNPEALYLALKAAVALNCEVQQMSRFDRKHYFYPDQPMGYQITQNFHPLAKNGYLTFNEFDGVEIATSKDGANDTIRIEKIQLEQDTGKKYGDIIDYNRAGIPLIEVVTKPDFDSIEKVLAFVKKYQLLVRHFDICSGDLETGAIRVDVNVNVNDSPRVEIKNISTTGDIVNAIKYEYNRQVETLTKGGSLEQQTRNWDGVRTNLARSKENAIDYRYFPDSELPQIILSPDIAHDIKTSLPESPDSLLARLTSSPHNLQLAHAKNLITEPELLHYYESFFAIHRKPDADKWVFQELLTAFAKLGKTFDVEIVKPNVFAHLVSMDLNLVSKRLILKHMVQNEVSLDKAIEQLGFKEDQKPTTELAEDICKEIILTNQQIVDRIQSGHAKAVEVLVGNAMKKTRGKFAAQTFRSLFKEQLGIS